MQDGGQINEYLLRKVLNDCNDFFDEDKTFECIFQPTR